MGDLGQRLIDGLGLDARTLLVGVVVGAALVLVVLLRESRLMLHPARTAGPRRLDGPIIALTVALAGVILERALSILL